MAAQLENYRWSADLEQFAARIEVPDAAGFFAKGVVVEPGTRALIVDEGQYLGEVPPGHYNLESFAEKLEFWRRKQATAILTRQEDCPLEITCEKLPTAENLSVAATVRVTVQMDDVALFLGNLMGSSESFSIGELRDALSPLLRQALWQTVGQLSITDLTGASVREHVDAAVEQALGVSLRRYGLQFVGVQTVSVRHDKYDEHRRKLGEAWLWREDIEQQKTLDELYSEEELQRIKRMEKTNELEVLAENVGVDRMESDLNTELRRIGVRNQLREAIRSEEFDKVQNEEELQKFLHERDKDRLLRDEEMDELLAGYRQRKEDRESAREHLLTKLDIERQTEIEQVRCRLDYETRLQSLDHEIELAKRCETKANLQWQQQVEQERREAEHRRQERDKQIQQERQWAQQESANRRTEELEEVLHEQRIDRNRGEIELAQTERRKRVQTLEAELKARLDQQQLESEKRRKEWELEVSQREDQTQMERLKQIQELNHESAKRQFELEERQKRLDTELQTLKEDKAHQRELDRLQTMKTMGTEALVATAGQRNAELLADMKKHEASQQTAQTQAMANQQNTLSEQQAAMQKELQEKMTEAERAKADAVVQAYREAMQMQQQNLQQSQQNINQAFSSMGQQPAGQQPVTSNDPSSAPQQPQMRVVVCPSCRSENSETDRCCSNCGKEL